jgi:hypothetical protein
MDFQAGLPGGLSRRLAATEAAAGMKAGLPA